MIRSHGTAGVTFAVVPVKCLAEAKQRLAPALTPDRRRRLVLAMLGDVLETLAKVPGVARTLVITRDEAVAALARDKGAVAVSEPAGADLNAAIAFGLETARKEGAGRGLVIPGDVPLATPDELAAVLAAAMGAEQIAIAPALDGLGTNALSVSLPSPIGPSFGPGSYDRHLALARKAGIRAKTVRRDGLGTDIDEPADLARLAGRASYAFLPRSRRERLTGPEAYALTERSDLSALLAEAEAATVAGHGTVVTFSKKVFIPLTQLCRDVCHYCTFAHAPRELKSPYLAPGEVLAIARAGQAAGCKEALFTLGDKPELRYSAARDALAKLGYATTLDYLEAMARLVLKETGLLPHLNPGVMTEDEIRRLRDVSASMGIMLETASPRLSERGGPHYGSPDKDPAVRIATMEAAGRAGVPFTTGILIGIGETRAERIDALLAIRDLHDRYGHIQEVIVQNFRAKPDTRMAKAPEPSLEDHLWTVAAARLILGPAMNIQAPPNLQPDAMSQLVRAGINDWGGVSPVTPDHVNPERPWPHLDRLREATEAAGRSLAERTAIYPAYALDPAKWLAKPLQTPVLRSIDTQGLGREDDWAPGDATRLPPVHDVSLIRSARPARSARIARILDSVASGQVPDEAAITVLFEARGDDFSAVCKAADDLRRRRNGDIVTYVVNRNINYTNMCTYGCKFCAFSKGRLSTDHRDKPYDLELEEIAKRTREAWERGATEVCLQGGIG
ncbi:MAG TPA: 7,8-didemethyl-8-hydroxy-5-deazariboflavin synthase CofG, partial [Hyphomicrobiaceae bacterium]|nr:7,8-didemethyl-8-hydroxy-5-deazariboflavin synthase CofG [Hyphomicrobiaceae bacterium]